MAEIDQEVHETLKELVKTNKQILKDQSFWKTFLRGVTSAIGATVGAAIVLTLFASLLQQLSGVNFIKPAVERILPYINTTANKAEQKTEKLLPVTSPSSARSAPIISPVVPSTPSPTPTLTSNSAVTQ